MAIDTETKRRSTICLIPPLPVPDGTVAAADRAHVCWLYSRAAATAVAITEIPGTVVVWDIPATQLATSDQAATLLVTRDQVVTSLTVSDNVPGKGTIVLLVLLTAAGERVLTAAGRSIATD